MKVGHQAMKVERNGDDDELNWKERILGEPSWKQRVEIG